MKTLLSLTLALALGAPAFGGRRHAVATSPSAQTDVTITFVGVTGGGSEAMVDAGVMSQSRTRRGRGPRATSMTRRVFGIRVDAAGASEGTTATLRAYLESHDGRTKIRVDGMELGTVPRVVDAQSPIGIVTRHMIEIEVPADVAEGAFASAVRWDVSTN
jgi:hypothetical protein